MRSIVCEASCHQVIVSCCHCVVSFYHCALVSLCHHVIIRSSGHHVIILFNIATDSLTDNIRGYRSASQTTIWHFLLALKDGRFSMNLFIHFKYDLIQQRWNGQICFFYGNMKITKKLDMNKQSFTASPNILKTFPIFGCSSQWLIGSLALVLSTKKWRVLMKELVSM